ncbi:MAG TPA: TIGR01777 family oxidoreductase [Pirellulales bacterium]|nr:TIGR01777 family oxidoreductase [Pirellulales bacterium]
MRALVTGASGFIGKHLLKRLGEAVVATRSANRFSGPAGVRVHQWDPMSGPLPTEALRDVDVVFHLAGEPVASGRWTAKKKTRIRDSRRVGTANLVRGLAAADPRPRVLVCSSAVGYYGDRRDEILDEGSAPGDDFLAEVCRLWELAASEAKRLGVRVVSARTGIVLGRDGGALAKMLLPFKLGLGGRLGSGRQWMPWIHVEDMIGLLLHAATQDEIEGPMNVTAPHPVTNREFTGALAATLRRPAVLPVPGTILKLVAGEFAEVLLSSQRAVPQVALRTGFAFQYPDLQPALEQILRQP